jgi:uracil-DNA glycosylase family 4
MAFYIVGTRSLETEQTELDFWHQHQCRVCPLNTGNQKRHGFTPITESMPPSGSKRPLIYMLGEAPGYDEDKQAQPFVGKAGQFLRRYIPDEFKNKLRWSNVVRTRPKDNAEPTRKAIECCRPSVAGDIAAAKPQAIFGFGNVPLHWALGEAGIMKWRGRRVPVRIGDHECWFFPMIHPSHVVRLSTEDEKGFRDQEFVFRLDLERAFQQVDDGLPRPEIGPDDIQVEQLNEDFEIEDALQEMANERLVGIDLETHGTRPYDSAALILSVALSSKNRTVAFGLEHPEVRKGADRFVMFSRFLQRAKCRLVSFSLGFEMEWLAYVFGADIILDNQWGDAQLQAFVLDERRGMFSLDALCLQHFGFNLKAIANVDVKRLAETPLIDVLHYNGLDAYYHRRLYNHQLKLLMAQGLTGFYQYRRDAVAAAVLQQLKGVPINQKTVQGFVAKYEGELFALEGKMAKLPEVHRFAKNEQHGYRPGAPRDVKAIFARLGKKIVTTDAEELKRIDHPLAKLTLQWRHSKKLLSTYVMPVLEGSEKCTVFPDGLLHPLLSLYKVRTSRTSSEEPNVQNWSKHSDGKEVRAQVEAPAGFRIVSFDYGQIQARNVAQESEDPTLTKYFWDRHDIHSDWAERLMQIYPEWVKEGVKVAARDKDVFKAYRQIAKNLFVFPSFFGAGGHTVANYLGIPPEAGEQMSEEFWGVMPGVRDWHQRLRDNYNETGYVTGLSGHRRHAPVAWTELINSPIQADETLIVLDAMTRLVRTGDENLISTLMVHDDLTFIWPEERVDELADRAIDIMLNCPFKWAHRVPIVVEMSVGQVWSKMEGAGEFASDTWRKDIKC